MVFPHPNTNLEKMERGGRRGGKKQTDMLLKGMYEKRQREGKNNLND
jgi:hypothetical protein